MRAAPPDIPPVTTRLRLAVPPDFSFRRTIYSHGWCVLPPFSHDPERGVLERTLELSGGAVVHCAVREAGRGLAVTARSRSVLGPEARREVRGQLASCLRLDESLAPFYREIARHPRFRWIRKAGAGRLLRAPTAFEDAVKILCTTNCTWALTTVMTTRLVQAAGSTGDGAHRAFPRPGALAAMSERELRLRCSTGYRAPFIRELAARVAAGTLDVEGWRTSPLPTPELEREIRSVKGMGPYAAGNMLRLCGRCDSLALDAWVRAQFARLHGRGRRVPDAAIERHYAPYGEWRGLLFWLEMTRYWHDRKFPL